MTASFFVTFGYLDSSNVDILHLDISFWISRCEKQVRNWWRVKPEMFTLQRMRCWLDDGWMTTERVKPPSACQKSKFSFVLATYLYLPSLSARSDVLQVRSTWNFSMFTRKTRQCNVIPTWKKNMQLNSPVLKTVFSYNFILLNKAFVVVIP